MKRYRTIVADPPGWPPTSQDGVADPQGAFLFLWATDEVYREGQAVTVARAWGFEPCGPSLIWRKPNFGLGRFPRPGHEPLLVCRRGDVKWLDDPAAVGTHSVQTWSQPRGQQNGGKQHSRKPEGALDLIERVAPKPWVELFARRARFGWDYWGDESLGTAEMPQVETIREIARTPAREFGTLARFGGRVQKVARRLKAFEEQA